MKEHYKVWGININDYFNIDDPVKKLEFLLKLGILAPSSHNSQPWSFKLAGNTIQILPEPKRFLDFSDANSRQTYISLGCVLENLIEAGNYFGLKTENSLGEIDDNHAIQITFPNLADKISNNPNKNHLALSISKRHTNRHKHDLKPLPQNHIENLKSLGDAETRIDIISDQNIKEKIANVIMAATDYAMNLQPFRDELSRYVISNISNSPTGMPGFTIGMPLPFSILAPRMIKLFNIGKLNHKQEDDLLKKHTTNFILISTKTDEKKDWIRIGMIYEKIALMSEQAGIRTAPLAAAIQMGNYYQDLQKILNTDFRPQFFCRIGYSDGPIYHSPRIDVSSVLK